MRFVRFVVRNKYKLGVDYPIVGANCVRPPADFDVILCGRGFSPKTGTLLSAFADISPNRGITHHYAKKYIACVGNGLDRSVKLYQIMRAIRESPLQPVGNNLSVVPQNNSKIHGRAWKPAPTNGRAMHAPTPILYLCVGNGQCPFR